MSQCPFDTAIALTTEAPDRRNGRTSDGHLDHQGQIWSTDGALPATTQQLVWYKE